MLERFTQSNELNIHDLVLEQEPESPYFDPERDLSEDEWKNIETYYLSTFAEPDARGHMRWDRIPQVLLELRTLGWERELPIDHLPKIQEVIKMFRSEYRSDVANHDRTASGLLAYYARLKKLGIPFKITAEDREMFETVFGDNATRASEDFSLYRLRLIDDAQSLGLPYAVSERDRDGFRDQINHLRDQGDIRALGPTLVWAIEYPSALELTPQDKADFATYLADVRIKEPAAYSQAILVMLHANQPVNYTWADAERMKAYLNSLSRMRNWSSLLTWASMFTELCQLLPKQDQDSDVAKLPEERRF